MTYELAKQLKDAGFPHNFFEEVETGGRYFSEPTLSELIAACGDRFDSLSQDDNYGWVCFGDTPELTGDLDYVYGKTPEEAVAKLWLALNSK